MIKKILLTLLLLIFFEESALADGEILVVQSVRIPPYEDALNGFLSVSSQGIKRLVLSELKTPNLAKDIKKSRPLLILAIGRDALLSVKEIKAIPIVYLMVLDHQSILSGEENIRGVNMNISQERQLHIISKALPDIKKLGLVYDPAKTGHIVERTQKVAAKMGINIIANEVHRHRDVPASIKDMKGKVDSLWMIPDTTVITPETVEFLLLFSIENKIPILTFSEKYVELGALISISVNPFDMGSRAGEMANIMLSEKQYGDKMETYVREETISINLKIARKLGIFINEEILTRARIIK